MLLIVAAISLLMLGTGPGRYLLLCIIVVLAVKTCGPEQPSSTIASDGSANNYGYGDIFERQATGQPPAQAPAPTPRERTDEQIIKELLSPNLTPLN